MSDAGTIETVRFQLPRRVIRKLLRGRWRLRARNVLVVANHSADMVHSLNRSGIDAVGIDDGPTGHNSDVAQVHFGSVAGGFPFPPHAFDLVLVGPCRAFENGLNGPEPLIAMANLLSSLKIKSRLVWLNRVAATQPDGDEHVHRLSQFPGDVTVHDYHDGWDRYLSLEWLIGRQRQVQLQLTTLTVPGNPISRLNWHKQARESALSRPQSSRQDRAA